MTPRTILLVDDDPGLLQALEMLVRQLGHQPVPAVDVASAMRVLDERAVDLVITDLRMPGGSGLDLLAAVQRTSPDTPVILLTAYGTIDGAVQAMQQGAVDFVLKPFDAGEMECRIQRALDHRRVQRENDYLREAAQGEAGLGELIGVAPAMQQVFELVQRVAPTDASVLITGETGTGKELIARAIHRRSPRADALLVPVNLAAIPFDLLESELFGHARGAFTGAVSDRPGKFELAHEGTLFLDEIGDAPQTLQPKLLRALQDGVVERVGGRQPRTIDTRVVSATHRSLDAEIAAGRFRADLYYRLRVIEIHMPALRDRREDIPFLVAHFLRKNLPRTRTSPLGVSERALALLQDYPWPGNVRELENVMARAAILCRGDVIHTDVLDLRPAGASGSVPTADALLDPALDRLEKEMILRALDETKQVKARAARVLGISERSLWYKLRKHGIS